MIGVGLTTIWLKVGGACLGNDISSLPLGLKRLEELDLDRVVDENAEGGAKLGDLVPECREICNLVRR